MGKRDLMQAERPSNDQKTPDRPIEDLTIGVVGPCAAGKSTLIAALKAQGYTARHIAQDHSFVPDMWRKIVNPDVLIYLDVSYTVSGERRPMPWSEREFNQQLARLEHARQHADLYINTDGATPESVFSNSLAFLQGLQR